MAAFQEMQFTADFVNWRLEVDRQLLLEFAITIADAGIDDAELHKHWETRMQANEFVGWFGKKYDLIKLADWI